MNKCVVSLLLVILMVSSNGTVSGAPVDIPLSLKGIDEENTNFHVSFESDFLAERDLNDFDGVIEEANFYSIKFVSPLYSKDITQANAYFGIGQVGDAVYKATFLGQDVKYNLDESIAWETGINFCIGKFSENNIIHVVDVKYRRAESMEYGSVVVGNKTYSASQLSLANDAKYDEWQVAFLLCKKIGVLLPYVGAKYSDVRVSAKVQAGGTVYNMNTTRSDKVLGVVLGCSLFAGDNFIVDAETRFGDEIGITLRAGYSF